MTRIFVSIAGTTAEEALEQVARVADERIGVELRVDSFDPRGERRFDLSTFRAATSRPLLYTRRSAAGATEATREELGDALRAGFDLVDVEWRGAVARSGLPATLDRIVLSHHDTESIDSLDSALDELTGTGAAHVKIVVTPASFDQDRSLLARLAGRRRGGSSLTLFGMGKHALYSRTLAPFIGSELSFVALDSSRRTAPGQLPVDRALELWSEVPPKPPRYLFAVVGNPAAHSRSPKIHNARFRAAGVSAVYGIIETDDLGPVLDVMQRKRPCAPAGISVTAPFKIDLYEMGGRRGWVVSERAARVGAANTAVRFDGRFLIDNTDILGFSRALIETSRESRVAILGAGGTARAAAFASRDRGHEVSIFNRTRGKAESLAAAVHGRGGGFEQIGSQRFDIIIDTLPRDAQFDVPLGRLRRGGLLVRSSYGVHDETVTRARDRGIRVFDGLDLLEAQAEEQSRRFIELAEGGA